MEGVADTKEGKHYPDLWQEIEIPDTDESCVIPDKHRKSQTAINIEALRSKPRRSFDPQGIILFPIRSFTPQQATEYALAAGFKSSKKSSTL